MYTLLLMIILPYLYQLLIPKVNSPYREHFKPFLKVHLLCFCFAIKLYKL